MMFVVALLPQTGEVFVNVAIVALTILTRKFVKAELLTTPYTLEA